MRSRPLAVALSSQIRRSPFAVTIVLGPFLPSLGLRLGLPSNLHAGERESHLCRAGGEIPSEVFKMTRIVSTRSNAPFKRYVRANRRKIGLVADVRDATRFNNHYELLKVLARIHSLLPSCYFEYEELILLADDASVEPAIVAHDCAVARAW
jgi:hypothetical protein